MINKNFPSSERSFSLENTAPRAGKRSYPQSIEDISWIDNASGSASTSGSIDGRSNPYCPSSIAKEPLRKKPRVIGDDELKEPRRKLMQGKRALQLQEMSDALLPCAKRTRYEVNTDVTATYSPQPQPVESRLVLRDPFMLQPHGIHHLQRKAEMVIFNSSLLQRISNRYGGTTIRLDLVDSRLQDLIRGSMRKAMSRESGSTSISTSLMNSGNVIAAYLQSDVAMDED